MIACKTECFQITGPTITKRPTDYTSCIDQIIISPLQLIVRLVSTPFVNTITLYLNNVEVAQIPYNISGNIFILQTTDITTKNGVLYEYKPGWPSNNLSQMTFTLGKLVGISPDLYKEGDEYIIQTIFCSSSLINVFYNLAFVRTMRSILSPNNLVVNSNNNNMINNTCNTKCSSKNNCNYCGTNDIILPDCNVRVPMIIIEAQTTVDGSELGDAVFNICDEHKISNDDNCCKIRYIKPENVKQTIFRKTNMSIYDVIKGKGKTTCEKVSSLFCESNLDITFIEFYDNILSYACIRYILSKLLFDEFNMNYLLEKFYDNFIEELGKSRYCAFSELFLDCNSSIYDYTKYFKYDLVYKDICSEESV